MLRPWAGTALGMTAPDDSTAHDGTDELVGETDPDRIEEIAAQLPVDPSPQEVAAYQEALGEGPGTQ